MASGRRKLASAKKDMECAARDSPAGWWALTGTPGTGKSAVARAVVPTVLSVEVADLAPIAGAPAPPRGAVPVDLGALAGWVRRHPPTVPVVVAGHLAHLLPIPRAVVLRCHPRTLRARLAKRGGLRPAELQANVEAEAIDLVATEARGLARELWEIDTTRRSVGAVAARVAALVTDGSGPSDRVDWLADRRATAELHPRLR